MFKGRFSSLAVDALFSIADVAPYVIAQGGHAKCFSRGLFFRLFSMAHFCSVLGGGDLASDLLVCGGFCFYISWFRWAGATRSRCLSRFRAGLFFACFQALALDYMNDDVPCSRFLFTLIKCTPLVPSRCAAFPRIFCARL